MTGSSQNRRLTATVVAALTVAVLAGCSDDGPATGSPTPASPSPSPTLSLTPRQEAAALVRQAPRVFDATYRLDTAGSRRPGAAVRVRVTPHRYRVDVTRGHTTASLLTAPAGLVSCRVGRGDRSCLLVAERGDRPPPLFDPGIQRIFRTMAPIIREARKQVRVLRAGVWQGPRRYGPAQCFEVTRNVPDPGVYCVLVEGRWAGVMARAEFASGSLSLRSVDGRFDADAAFTPPTRPTPLPD